MRRLLSGLLLIALAVGAIVGGSVAADDARLDVQLAVLDVGGQTEHRGWPVSTELTILVVSQEPDPVELSFSTWHEDRHTQLAWPADSGGVVLHSGEEREVVIRAEIAKSGIRVDRPAQLQARDVRTGRLAVLTFTPRTS